MLLQSQKQKIKVQSQSDNDTDSKQNASHTIPTPSGLEIKTAAPISKTFNDSNPMSRINSVNELTSKMKRSEGLLSPHQSVFQALQNPELDLEMTQNDWNNPDSFYKNNEFSITSWQSVSGLGDLAPGNYSNNNKNFTINASLNNPYSRIMSNKSKLNSPNVGSVLSSSDNEDRNIEDLNVQTSSHKVIVFDSGSDDDDSDAADDANERGSNYDEDEDETVDSSTIVPSFVMPRVSIPSLTDDDLGLTNNYSATIVQSFNSGVKTKTDDSLKIKVQVVGSLKDTLIGRLKFYRKTLNKIEFTNQNPNLIILLVNEDNYLLPNLINRPFIPIIIKGEEVDHFESRLFSSSQSGNNNCTLFKNLMICEPLRLTSIEDDLISLIEFLTNIKNGSQLEEVLQTIEDSSKSIDSDEPTSLPLSQVNSILIDNSTLSLRKSINKKKHKRKQSRKMSQSSTKRRQSFKSIYSHDRVSEESISVDDDINGTRDYNAVKNRLLMGITVGVVSLTIVLIWKELVSQSQSNDESLSKGFTTMGSGGQSRFRRLFFASGSATSSSTINSSNFPVSSSDINSIPGPSPSPGSSLTLVISTLYDSASNAIQQIRSPGAISTCDSALSTNTTTGPSDLFFNGIDVIKYELEALGRMLFTSGILWIERTKLTLFHLISLSGDYLNK